jgi:glycosyltransferase involved in cell wall biosynthesis
MEKKRRRAVCVIAFSPVARDARVLRQIQYLSTHYDLTVIGHGQAHPAWRETEGVTWVPTLAEAAAEGSLRRLAEKTSGLLLLLAGRLHPSAFSRWFWRQPIMRDALAKAVASGCDAFHANDWNALPVAAEAARRLGARLVFDAHEYAPLEFENRTLWRLLYAPVITHLLRVYATRADASMTVASAIAERYRREFGFAPEVILNAPDAVPLPDKVGRGSGEVRLIHHGAAIPDRRLEEMIKAVALCDGRFSLHLMLTGDTAYVNALKRTADALAPGRVSFHEPVAPADIVRRVAEYDVGFCFIAPTNYNYLVCLPNKFFDFVAAGLPVCIGPSPSMAEVVRERGFGVIAASFDPRDLAAALDGLNRERLSRMRRAARAAAREINAEREMGKMLEIYRRILPWDE